VLKTARILRSSLSWIFWALVDSFGFCVVIYVGSRIYADRMESNMMITPEKWPRKAVCDEGELGSKVTIQQSFDPDWHPDAEMGPSQHNISVLQEEPGAPCLTLNAFGSTF
jgi:hypothetical protein